LLAGNEDVGGRTVSGHDECKTLPRTDYLQSLGGKASYPADCRTARIQGDRKPSILLLAQLTTSLTLAPPFSFASIVGPTPEL
jgi:hypothetical protein